MASIQCVKLPVTQGRSGRVGGDAGQKAFAMSVLHLPSSWWVCGSLENARWAFPVSILAELEDMILKACGGSTESGWVPIGLLKSIGSEG